MQQNDWEHGGFGIYVHWPFCAAKCPYCDFNSHVVAAVDQDAWREALLRELERGWLETKGRLVRSVFFGGGTPSLMPPETVQAILDKVHALWPCANTLEVTLEANPSSVEAQKFADFRRAGVNRVSVGVQALVSDDLRRLGRLHSVEHARRAVDLALTTFEHVSFDLIYGRQDQSLSQWEAELSEAVKIGTGHLSLYQLTIEPGTAFAKRQSEGGLHGLPDEDLGADFYELTQQICADAGFLAYEVSNHAKGDARSVHNQIYWLCGDYLGIGPGAHGRISGPIHRVATQTHLLPAKWIAQVNSAATGESDRSILSGRQHAEELVMMGLRLVDGVDSRRVTQALGYEPGREGWSMLADLGFVRSDGAYLTVTDTGRPILNRVIQTVIEDFDRG